MGLRFSRCEARPSFTSGPDEAQHLERRRGVEGRAHHAQPVVERVLGEADRGLRALGELGRDLEALGFELVVLHAQRDQADALGLLAVDRLAEQQVVLGLGHAAEQRPDDHGVIAGGDAEPRVAVDDLGLLRGDRDVGQDAGDQARADGGAAHGADDRLGAVDDVVDDVARFLPGSEQRVVVLHVVLDQVEVAAGREHLAAGALDDHAIDRVVAVDVAPHVDQLGVHDGVGGVVLLRAIHGDPQHLGMRAIEHQALIALLPVGHELSSVGESLERFRRRRNALERFR